MDKNTRILVKVLVALTVIATVLYAIGYKLMAVAESVMG